MSFLVFGVFSAHVATAASCASFTRNLALGARGEDVRMLQQILNSDKATRVADEGVGSPGNESTYFGVKTKIAVIKFQNLYAEEVLTPAGLMSASGFVGVYSRAKFLALCSGKGSEIPPVSIVPPPTPTPIVPTPVNTPATTVAGALNPTVTAPSFFKTDQPVIMSLSTYMAPRGATVNILGLGLASTGNVVHLDSYLISNVNTGAGGTLSFTIPSDAPRGKHALWVSSANGDTNQSFFVVTDPSVAPPIVTGFTPKEGFFGTVVTVTGSGFLPLGNDVRISYGVIANIPSSDGKTLQFTVLPDMPGLKAGEDRPEFNVRVPYWFTVLNDNGVSSPSVFTMKV